MLQMLDPANVFTFSQVPTIIPLSHSPLSPTFQVHNAMKSNNIVRLLTVSNILENTWHSYFFPVAGPIHWLPPSYLPSTHPSFVLVKDMFIDISKGILSSCWPLYIKPPRSSQVNPNKRWSWFYLALRFCSNCGQPYPHPPSMEFCWWDCRCSE